MTGAVMKTSNKFASALFVLAGAALFGVGFVSPVGKVMAEGVAQAVQAVAIQTTDGERARQCEEREVEADEGYGVSTKVIRLICH
jgi:hypothetical protein